MAMKKLFLTLLIAIGACQPEPVLHKAGSSLDVEPPVDKQALHQQSLEHDEWMSHEPERQRERARIARLNEPPKKALEDSTAACTSSTGEWRCSIQKPSPKLMAATGTRPPIIPSSWTIGAWFIDPANASTTASDGNNCTTSATACLTYAEIAARWGTYSPRLRQNTTITVLSTSPGNGATDPVYFTPYIEDASLVQWIGVLNATTQVATGTLAGVTPKNRGTHTDLSVTLSGSSRIEDLVLDTTRSSRGMIQAGTNPFTMAQTMSGTGFTTNYPLPTEDDGWANLDNYTEYAPAGMNFVSVAPVMMGQAPVQTNAYTPLVFTQLTILYPPNGNGNLGGATDNFYVEGPVLVSDCNIQKHLVSINSGGTEPSVRLVDNIYHQNFTIQGSPFASLANTPSINPDGFPNMHDQPALFGGATSASNTQSEANLTNVWVDYDARFAGAGINPTFSGTLLYGCMEIQQRSRPWNAFAYPTTNGACSTNAIVWGIGQLRLGGNTRWTYPGATATNTFLSGIALLINESTSACSHTGAAPDVINCGITVNVANLDAAAGAAGFGGLAFNPGGAAFSSVQ